MKYQPKINTLKSIKKVKIPNKSRNNGFSLLFGSALKEKEVPKIAAAAFEREPINRGLLGKFDIKAGVPRKGNREKIAFRAEVLERIKKDYPPELVRTHTKRQLRRKFCHLFAPKEWYVFCVYAKSCRRGNKEAKMRQRSRRNKTGETSTRLAYENFINSPLWEERKNRYYQNNPRQCAACGSFKFIHLHHMVYGEFGKEPDEHMIPLCAKHHKDYHAKNGTQRHMVTKTRAYIEFIKAGVASFA